MVCSVSDEGIGIPESEQPRIFEKFYRVHREGSEGEVGTGLGLYMCKRIAEAHGGTISVVSEEGAGSTFTVRVPLAGPVPHGENALPTLESGIPGELERGG